MQDTFSEFKVNSLKLTSYPGSQLDVVVEETAPDRVLMAVTQVASVSFANNTGELVISTIRGEIRAVLTQAPDSTAVVVFLGGHVAGANGPEGLFADLAQPLKHVGISTLRVNHRNRGGYEHSVLDIMVCVSLLRGVGLRDVVIVGHQMGGAVAIAAGALVPSVKAVAALGSKTTSIDLVDRIAPRPLLLIHGDADPEEAPRNSDQLYARAGEPKELVHYPGTRFFFTEVHQELLAKLGAWLADQFGKGEEFRRNPITPASDGKNVEREVQTPDGRPVQITLTRQDLLETEADALVSPVASWLDLRTTIMGKRLIEDMGDEPYWQLREQAPLLLGEVGVTSPGRLKAKYIIHAVTAGESENDSISNEELVINATFNTLNEARKRESRSIGIPALGTGFRGEAPEKVAHLMLGVLLQHLRQKTTLEHIIFSITNETVFRAFADQITMLPARLEG